MRNGWLMVAGGLSAAASLLHIGIIVGGPDWYRFFGAGETMARAAERGSWVPTIMTTGIALVLALWALYAWSGAGLVRRLPLLRPALVVIAAIYLLRGLAPVPMLVVTPDRIDTFVIVTSLIALGYGVIHAIGTWRAWPVLRRSAGPLAAR